MEVNLKRMKIKVIKNDIDYSEALKEIDVLMSKNPSSGSIDGEKLSLLATLVEGYESNLLPESLPDPVDAILFRMEQQNLKPSDLVQFIGSRSKVSEILSRKRPLTISMMRALEKGLGIPAKVLIKESDEFRNTDKLVWGQFPIREMEKRGYFEQNKNSDDDISSLMESFFSPLGSTSHFFALLRQSHYVRSSRPMDKQSLMAWSAYVVREAKKISYETKFKNGSVTLDFMKKVASLSRLENGPAMVQKLLSTIGVGFVVEPHFPKTYVDGATLVTDRNHPIIGMTIRHNRLDNFWFTLMHELSHISLHYGLAVNSFYDDLDEADTSNLIEQQADKLAGEALIPEDKWVNSPARIVPSPIAAQSLADELGIHISIVAGRMRHENDRYRYLNSLVGLGEVRKNFTNKKWEK